MLWFCACIWGHHTDLFILLLDKYADEGIENTEDMKIPQVNPFDDFGSPLEIVKLFGGKIQYLKAITELEREIYKGA